jgi:hypothetical protein
MNNYLRESVMYFLNIQDKVKENYFNYLATAL